MSNINLSQLLEAGVHFGHKAYRWNPKMFPYIYSEINNIHILDLVQSASLLKEANKYVQLAAQDNKYFLIVGTKKKAVLRRKELKKLRQHLDGIKFMETLPDIVILIDQKREMTALKECRNLNIPIVSILDTNCDPDLIDVPIPGNDDAVRSIKLILKSLTDSIIIGKSNTNS